MPFVAPADAARFDLHGTVFTGLASPSRGSAENSVWIVQLPAGSPAVPHQVTREEIFVVLDGRAVAVIGEETHHLTAGSALIVPPHTTFQLSNPNAEPFRAVAVLPVGGQAQMPNAEPFTPPWAS